MFKSVFTKYITAFMLIIIISFAMMITIIASVVNTYSGQLKDDMISRASQSAVEYLEGQLETHELMDLPSLSMIYGERLRPVLDVVAGSAEDIFLLVTDNSGKIIMTGGAENGAYTGRSIPKPVMDEINNGVEVRQRDTLDGLFDVPYLVHASPIFLDDFTVVGTVFVCSASMTLNPLIEVMVKTVIMASLWVMLAALIAVYFISDRIIGPLKAMSRAAKSFAAGKFDVRVPVSGRDEVAELAIAFNHMADSLSGLEGMRNSFMANVSHDLRTPMTTISGFIDGMLAGAIPPEKHEYYLGVISTEVKRLARLVASLLDISRMQAGDRKFNMTPFDICEMARQIIISFEQKLEAKRLDVEFLCDEEKMFVLADHDAIYQILYNICDNAVKFSREGGKYRVSLSLSEKKKKVHVTVFNEGQGISPEDLPNVFERFYKSDKSRGLDKTGVGLGLFIAKTIIASHHEEIWVESEYGENCAFHFTLEPTYAPLKEPRTATPEERK
ncbi:MAG: cell wall metabolism sensor histidine kinase WalK [Ruminococcaceae bacterium]|nr:cell wall metabolism sensor histidine kinase WalK [Oscillospiraceae bacterium]